MMPAALLDIESKAIPQIGAIFALIDVNPYKTSANQAVRENDENERKRWEEV